MSFLRKFDVLLKESAYLVGDHMTLADIVLASTFKQLFSYVSCFLCSDGVYRCTNILSIILLCMFGRHLATLSERTLVTWIHGSKDLSTMFVYFFSASDLFASFLHDVA